MTAEHIVCQVLDALEAPGAPHTVVGSFSSNLYGLPRPTRDADDRERFAPASDRLRKLLVGAGKP
jgi:hypothetical protein